MTQGELAQHSEDYRDGHNKGAERAFAEMREAVELSTTKRFTRAEVIALIAQVQHDFTEFCESYGCAEE